MKVHIFTVTYTEGDAQILGVFLNEEEANKFKEEEKAKDVNLWYNYYEVKEHEVK